MFISNQSRGIRNNNPLNIRRSSSQWKGLVDVPTDDRFCQFKTLAYGWRAAFHLLTRTYYGKYGHNTIRSVISKWAPPSENDTQAYIDHVSRLTGIPSTEPLGPPSTHSARWLMLAEAMSIHENGTSCPDHFAMLQGWQMLQEENLSDISCPSVGA